MKKDKLRIEDENWNETHIKSYLDVQSFDGTDSDFHCLYRAYTRMNADVFLTFVKLFKAEGRNVHATNKAGQSLADIIAEHKQSQQYLSALTA